MNLFLQGEDGEWKPLAARSITFTMKLDHEATERIQHWVEGSESITLRPFDRDRMLREEFEE